MSDKIANAYLAMRKPKRFPSLETVFGSHHKEQTITEEINVAHSYVMDDKNSDSAYVDKLHETHKLHDDVDGRISGYTKKSFDVNSALHDHYNDKKHDRGEIDNAKEIEKALNKNVAKEHFHVYTGIKHSPFKNVATINGNHMVHLPSFTSTTTNFRKTLMFTERDDTTHHNPATHSGDVEPMALHVLKIHVHPGVSIASVRHVAQYSHEDEMLLNRGYDMKIDPVPTKVRHESAAYPLYVWNAYPVAKRGRNLDIDTGKQADEKGPAFKLRGSIQS